MTIIMNKCDNQQTVEWHKSWARCSIYQSRVRFHIHTCHMPVYGVCLPPPIYWIETGIWHRSPDYASLMTPGSHRHIPEDQTRSSWCDTFLSSDSQTLLVSVPSVDQVKLKKWWRSGTWGSVNVWKRSIIMNSVWTTSFSSPLDMPSRSGLKGTCVGSITCMLDSTSEGA